MLRLLRKGKKNPETARHCSAFPLFPCFAVYFWFLFYFCWLLKKSALGIWLSCYFYFHFRECWKVSASRCEFRVWFASQCATFPSLALRSILFFTTRKRKANRRWRKGSMARDRKVIPDPIDDRKFQEWKESGSWNEKNIVMKRKRQIRL